MCLFQVSPPANAARPLVTDDARLTDPHACQLETWRKALKGGWEFWAYPACNPNGNLEITLGGNSIPDGSGGRASDFVLQGKTLFKPLETDSWGWGLAAGAVWHGDPAPGQPSQAGYYLYLPFSVSFAGDRTVVHVNIGANDNRDTGQSAMTWGLGTELNFTPRFAIIAETYGDDRSNQYYQAGVRFWVIPGRFQIDATRGAQAGDFGATAWWTIGVRLITPPFLK